MSSSSHDAADAAMIDAFTQADKLADLFDRYSGDSGTDPAPILEITERLRSLYSEVVAAFGHPSVKLGGGLVDPAFLSLYNKPRS